jgi:hypothetical protein
MKTFRLSCLAPGLSTHQVCHSQTDLVLAQKDACGKFGHRAGSASSTFSHMMFSNHAAIYSSDFGNRIAIKAQNFALT